MRIFFYFLPLFTLIICSQAQAQKSLYSYKYKSVRMSKQKAQVVCPIFKNSEYPYHGIGIKVGDPVTLTYKYYHNHNLALAIDAGSAASGLYTKHHRESFTRNLSDTLASISSIRYVRHEVINEYVVEAKLLYQQKADKLFPGLQSYIGAGWQYRRADIEYSYFYEIGFDETESGKFRSNKSTHGPVVAAGLEYAYFSLPVSAFIELSMFYDVAADPGWTRFQGGVGIRYIF
jgi:hypothetical protein